MTDAIDTSTSEESELPGITYGKDETSLGKSGFKLLVQFDKLHDSTLPKLHDLILKFGRVLLAGRAMYEADDPGFGAWIAHFHLDTGKLGRDQKERHACMQIAKLYDTGNDTEEEGAAPRKLDLAECARTRPTDIMKWVRQDQPEVVPDLMNKRQKRANNKKPPKDEEEALPEDEIGDLGVGRDELVDSLRAEIARLREQLAEMKTYGPKLAAYDHLNAALDMLDADYWMGLGESEALGIKRVIEELRKRVGNKSMALLDLPSTRIN